MYGGPGFDFVAIDYIQNPDTFGSLYGGPGNDVVYGGAKKDTLYQPGDEVGILITRRVGRR
jgi:hypothetical protein